MKIAAASILVLIAAGAVLADPPASQPSLAAQRLTALEKNAGALEVGIRVYVNGKGDEEQFSLLGPDNKSGYKEPFCARLTSDEMTKLLRHLATEGFLAIAFDGNDRNRPRTDPLPPPYLMLTAGEFYLEQTLRPETLNRLEGIKSVLPDRAAAKMEGLLLPRVRKIVGVPATQPAAKPLTEAEIVAKCREWLALYSKVGLKDAPRKQFSKEDIQRQPQVSQKDGLWRVEFANSKGGEVVIWLDAAGTQTKVEHSGPTLINEGPAQTQPDVAKLITDLSSEDGQVRAVATKAIFALGKDALELLAKAGAKQISPFGTIGSKRIDVVFSLLDGLKPNPVPARAGYRADGFGIRAEKGCTLDDVKKMGERHGFVISGTFDPTTTPSCYVKLKAGKNLADVLKAVLSEEVQVMTVNLNYFES